MQQVTDTTPDRRGLDQPGRARCGSGRSGPSGGVGGAGSTLGVLLLATTLGGCAGLATTGSPAPGATSTASAGTSDDASNHAGAGGTGSSGGASSGVIPPAGGAVAAAPSSLDELGPVVASREATRSGSRMRLDVFSPRRAGNTAELTVRLTWLAVGQDPDGAVLSRSHQVPDGAGTPNGLRLLDSQHGELLLPAENRGSTLCSPELLSLGIEPGDVVYASCLYRAPRSDTVTVMAPSFGAFPDVPVR